MRVILAKNAGFCYGVKKAVETVNELIALPENKTIYTLGKLIHNPSIIEELEAKGVKIISEDEDILEDTLEKMSVDKDEKIYIVIRAHGISLRGKNILREAEKRNENIKIIDCTCPRVVKVQRIVEENTRDGETAVIIGDANHPEVRGIAGHAHGKCEIYADCESLETAMVDRSSALASDAPSIVVSQTTFNLGEWKKSQLIIKKYCTKIKIFDTICNVTESRQNEVRALSRNVDIMIVVGGKESSNTNKLWSISREVMNRKKGKPGSGAYLIENASELDSIPLSGNLTIGLTAGASTPSGTIQEVFSTMVDTENKLNEISGEDFEQMLEQSLKPLNNGDAVKGTIISVTPNELHVDLGAKVTGIIPYDQLSLGSSESIEDKYKVGDEIEAMVVKISDLDGVATLSRNRIEASLNWNKIVEAKENNTTLEGVYQNPVNGGIIMSIDGQRVFVPASQTGLSRDADLSTLTGTKAQVKILDVNAQRRRAVASARAILREERKAQVGAFWDEIEEGKEYDGVVKSLTKYGAFIDLGGVDGMIHSSELSWKRIHHPSEVISVGETIHVFVKSFDKETRRISLGYKTEESNPWNIFTSNYSVNDVVSVKIVSILNFGAFAEVVPGVDGLIHISQIANNKIENIADVLKVGQVVDAKITDIDFENHKISLSMRALLEGEEKEDEEAVAEEAPAEEAEKESETQE